MIEPKIGDWIKPIDPIINSIHYGYNLRLIIEIINDDEFITTSDSFGIEEGLWNRWNTSFAGRAVVDEIYE